MIRKPLRVPRYLVPVAKKLRAIEKAMQKDTGFVIDSPTVKSERQPDGRVQLHAKVKEKMKAAAPSDKILYVSFRVNAHDGEQGNEVITFSSAGGGINYIGVARDVDNQFALFHDQSFVPGSNSQSPDGSWLLDTWYTVQMKLDFSSPDTTVVTPRFDGSELATFATTGAGILMEEFRFGAIDRFFGLTNNHDADDLKLGTTGWGSSNLFSADFSSTIVPPFDEIDLGGAPTPDSLSIVAGALHCSDADSPEGVAGYALKSLTFPA
jgi:hypothetical protein